MLYNNLGPYYGYPIQYSVANPAAGAGFTLTIDTRKIIRLMCGAFHLTTSAAVATRYAKLEIFRGAQSMFTWTSAEPTTAGQAVAVEISPVSRSLATIPPDNNQYLAIPPELILDPMCSIAVTVIGMDAGDQIADIRFWALRYWDIGI